MLADQWNVAGYAIQIATPALVKISILLLYLRLFSSQMRMRISTFVLLGIVVAYFLAFELSHLLGCQPIKKLTQPQLPGKCYSVPKHLISQSTVNVATDLLVLVLPIPTALRLHAPRRQRVAIIVIFSLAAVYVQTRAIERAASPRAPVTWVLGSWTDR